MGAVALISGMRREVRQHDGLARMAEEQHGVVSHRQLVGLGYSTGAIGRALASGRLHRVHRGVYAVGHPGVSQHGSCLAAVLACGQGTLLSHESAAWLWGLLPRFPTQAEVTVPERGHTRKNVHIHHSTILEAEDREIREMVPVTAVPRTLLDLAARSRDRDLGRALERSDRLALLDLAAIDSLLARSGGHSGKSRLKEALSLYRDPSFFRSGLERRFLALVQKAGLPRPAMNTFAAGHEIDAFWEAERFAVELDGYGTHGTRAAFERDPVRIEDLKLAGIDAIRITARRVEREPDRVVVRLRTLLERRRRQLQL